MDILHLEEGNEQALISQTIEALKKGALVVAPSDTVYGLLVDASNEEAVKKLIHFKNRPIGKSISVFVANLKMAHNYVETDEKQNATLQQLLPGPFTIILQSRHKTSKLIESEKGTLGIRVPVYSFINKLLESYGRPVTATSANIGGRSPHYSIDSFLRDLPLTKKNLLDLVIDAGKLPHNKPSTVLDLTSPSVKIMRAGDIVFNDQKNYISDSPAQTKKIARFIFDKISRKDKPIVFILKGELGVGKTIFVKGIAESLGINNIISPTFTIYYEYPIKNQQYLKNLYHVDLYNVEDPEEFRHLGIEKYLTKDSLFFIEWGEKSGEILPYLKKKANIVYIELTYLDEKKREIIVKNNL